MRYIYIYINSYFFCYSDCPDWKKICFIIQSVVRTRQYLSREVYFMVASRRTYILVVSIIARNRLLLRLFAEGFFSISLAWLRCRNTSVISHCDWLDRTYTMTTARKRTIFDQIRCHFSNQNPILFIWKQKSCRWLRLSKYAAQRTGRTIGRNFSILLLVFKIGKTHFLFRRHCSCCCPQYTFNSLAITMLCFSTLFDGTSVFGYRIRMPWGERTYFQSCCCYPNEICMKITSLVWISDKGEERMSEWEVYYIEPKNKRSSLLIRLSIWQKIA